MLRISKTKFPVRIQRVDYGTFTFYSFSDNKKMSDGRDVVANVPCHFKKGVEVENGTFINIKEAYVDWYVKKFKTNVVIFILDFDVIKKSPEGRRKAIQEFVEETKEEEFLFDE